MPTAAECYGAFHNGPEQKRASRLDDGEFKNCACEVHSFTEGGGSGVAVDAVLVRVLTDPKQYSLTDGELLDAPMQGIHGRGFSMIRSGATDEEIRSTIRLLVEQSSEPQTLAGAATISVETVRAMEADTRWFGVYATDAEGNDHHADILGTAPQGTKKEVNDLRILRRRKLKQVLEGSIIIATNEDDLILKLREIGV
jgi:hypothetical protein